MKLHTMRKVTHCVHNYTLCVKLHNVHNIHTEYWSSFWFDYEKFPSVKKFTLVLLLILVTNMRCVQSPLTRGLWWHPLYSLLPSSSKSSLHHNAFPLHRRRKRDGWSKRLEESEEPKKRIKGGFADMIWSKDFFGDI